VSLNSEDDKMSYSEFCDLPTVRRLNKLVIRDDFELLGGAEVSQIFGPAFHLEDWTLNGEFRPQTVFALFATSPAVQKLSFSIDGDLFDWEDGRTVSSSQVLDLIYNSFPKGFPLDTLKIDFGRSESLIEYDVKSYVEWDDESTMEIVQDDCKDMLEVFPNLKSFQFLPPGKFTLNGCYTLTGFLLLRNTIPALKSSLKKVKTSFVQAKDKVQKDCSNLGIKRKRTEF
jgi:hypothetical protein